MIASLYQSGLLGDWAAAWLWSDISGVAFDGEDVGDGALHGVEAHVVAGAAPGVLLTGEQIADDVLVVLGETEGRERHLHHGLLRFGSVRRDGDKEVLVGELAGGEGGRDFLP